MRQLSFLALMLVAATPALAAEPAPSAVVDATAPIDPARLAAARALVDLAFPPERRDTMFEQMLTPMMANMREGITQSPEFAVLASRDPRMGAMFDQFMHRQFTQSIALLQERLPDMLNAMSRAYARRFTVAQLGEVSAFYRTPTGHAFMEQAPQIMNDPDVAAWMRTMMARSIETVRTDVAQFIRDARAKAGQP